jgi:hypothetical protein
MRFIASVLIFAVLCGCGSSSAFESEKKKWETEGWRFVELVGERDSDAVSLTWSSGQTAKLATAFAFDGTEKRKKEYAQIDSVYLVVTMAAKSGRYYSMVFAKAKK